MKMKNNFNIFSLFKSKQKKLRRKQKNCRQVMKEISKRIKEQKDFEDLYIRLMEIKACASLKKAGINVKKL